MELGTCRGGIGKGSSLLKVVEWEGYVERGRSRLARWPRWIILKLDAQRQYMVIGTLALLLIVLCNFPYEQGSGPGGDRRG